MEDIGRLLPHTLCYHCPRLFLRQGTTVDQMACGWVGTYISCFLYTEFLPVYLIITTYIHAKIYLYVHTCVYI